MILTGRKLRGMDGALIFAVVGLLAVGLLALYSASFQKAGALGVSFMARQMIWVGLGLLLAALLVAVDYHRWLEWAYLLYGLNLLLLILVLGVGVVRGGAQRWLTFGGLTLQPSEFAKLTLILVLARTLGSFSVPSLMVPSNQRLWMGIAWRAVGAAGLFLVFPMALIFKEPNLGTALVLLPIALAMLWVWGLPFKILAGLGAVGAAAAPFLWSHLAAYQRSRLLVFLNPNLDPLGAGYTVIQSKIAVGSGGLVGKGWMAGTQNQLNFLPERHTDFIFSVIGEEWGFLGSSICLGLFMLLLFRGIQVARQTRDPYGRLLVVGLVAMLLTHVVVNTGMAMGLAPVVGLPLPFLSYGGSWLMTCLAAVGMILSVAVRRPV